MYTVLYGVHLFTAGSTENIDSREARASDLASRTKKGLEKIRGHHGRSEQQSRVEDGHDLERHSLPASESCAARLRYHGGRVCSNRHDTRRYIVMCD